MQPSPAWQRIASIKYPGVRARPMQHSADRADHRASVARINQVNFASQDNGFQPGETPYW
jgi:hypothetical protein